MIPSDPNNLPNDCKGIQFRFPVYISIVTHANRNTMKKMVKEKDIIRMRLFHHIKEKREKVFMSKSKRDVG